MHEMFTVFACETAVLSRRGKLDDLRSKSGFLWFVFLGCAKKMNNNLPAEQQLLLAQSPLSVTLSCATSPVGRGCRCFFIV